MTKWFLAILLGLTGIVLSACDSGGLTTTQKVAANRQWNEARAGVLASLASDQYKSGDLVKCRETLDQALRLAPDSAALRLQAARLAIEQGKLDVAQLQLEQARREEPTNAETDYLTGVIYQRWQQPQKAADAYAAAAAKNPGELCYVLAQAEMLVALNRPAEALSLLQTKAGSFEHSGAIRDEIGQLLLQQRRFGEAVSSLREACMLCSDDTTFAEHLAFALLADHQYVEACDRLDRLSKEPGYDKRADLLAALGECQSQTGQLAMAKQSFTTATQLNPACAGYWLGLAKVSIQLDDLPAAEADIRRATAADPKSSDAQCLLGYLRLKQNQLPESLAAFRAAADLDSSDSTNLSLQGYVLTRMGRKIDALTVCERALKINPRDDLAKQLIPPCDQHD